MASLLDIVRVRILEIEGQVIARSESLNGWEVRHARYLDPGEYEYLDDWKALNVGDVWARQGETAFMRREAQIPEDWKGLRVGLVMTTGGEGLLHLNGEPFHGVDDNRGYILLTKDSHGGERFSCEIEIKTGGYWEYVVKNPEQTYVLSEAKLVGIDPEIEDVFYDFSVVHEAAASEKRSYRPP